MIPSKTSTSRVFLTDLKQSSKKISYSFTVRVDILISVFPHRIEFARNCATSSGDRVDEAGNR